MRKLYLCLLFLLGSITAVSGQCNLLATGLPGLILDYQSTNLFNCSGVAYNPIQAKYYAVRAGNPGFPLETWTAGGGQLYSTTAGFDWRGMWWNPNTNQLEGNGYAGSGIWRADLNASGWALNTGANIFTGMAQPDAQSVGDYDAAANEIIYYFNGRIYRYSRATNAAIGNYPLVGCPVGFGNLNSTTVVYTGCPGKEIGVLDYVLKRFYVFQKNTGLYVGMCQLPASAVTTSSFRTSWANGLLWLFDLGTGNWFSYSVFDVILPELSFTANATWYNPQNAQIDWSSFKADEFQRFEVERSMDGATFVKIGNLPADAGIPSPAGDHTWTLQDATTPQSPVIYYRVQGVLRTGDVQTSEIMVLTRTAQSEMTLGAWPVPADHAVQLRFEHATAGTEVDVIDAVGKRIYQSIISEELENAGGMQLETESWADGIYLLRLRSQNGKEAVQRLVIQH